MLRMLDLFKWLDNPAGAKFDCGVRLSSVVCKELAVRPTMWLP